MMPSDCDGLKQKAFSGEAVDIPPLNQFLGGKAVSIGGEFTLYVWFCQPTTTEKPGF